MLLSKAVLILILWGILGTMLERFLRFPILATFIGRVLVVLFDYKIYSTVGNIDVFFTTGPLFSIKIFSKRFSLVPIDAAAITIGKIIVVSTASCSVACIDNILQHEYVHVEQYEELGSIPFFFLYLWYFAVGFFTRLVKCIREQPKSIRRGCIRHIIYMAYHDNKFEVEARSKSGY